MTRTHVIIAIIFFPSQQGETGANVLVGMQISRIEMDEFRDRANNLTYDYVVVNDDDDFQLLMHWLKPTLRLKLAIGGLPDFRRWPGGWKQNVFKPCSSGREEWFVFSLPLLFSFCSLRLVYWENFGLNQWCHKFFHEVNNWHNAVKSNVIYNTNILLCWCGIANSPLEFFLLLTRVDSMVDWQVTTE